MTPERWGCWSSCRVEELGEDSFAGPLFFGDFASFFLREGDNELFFFREVKMVFFS